jgi:hypothetical protein
MQSFTLAAMQISLPRTVHDLARLMAGTKFWGRSLAPWPIRHKNYIIFRRTVQIFKNYFFQIKKYCEG